MKINKVIAVLILSSVCFMGNSLMGDPAATTKGTKTMTNAASMAKIAVVDYRRILSQDPQLLKDKDSVSHEWRDLYNALQETLKPVHTEVSTLQAQYQTKKKEFEALQKSGVSSKEALQKKYGEELAPLEYRLQAQYEQVQNFTYAELTKIQNVVVPKIQKATDEIIKAAGWDFVINKDAVMSTLSAGSRFNITSDVLSILNAQYVKEKASEKKKDPKKAAKAA